MFRWSIDNVLQYEKAMADLNYARNRLKKTMIKTSFDSHPYPAGTNRLNAQAGLLTHLALLRLPSILPVAKNATSINPLEESRYTATGIVPDSHRIPFSPFGRQCGFKAPCALQMYVIFSEWQSYFLKYFLAYEMVIICGIKLYTEDVRRFLMRYGRF